MTTSVTNIAAIETKARKKALETKLRELLRSSYEPDDIRIEHLADPLDQIRSNADREMTLRRLDHQAHVVREVESALSKLDDETYGACEECEEPISRRRLDALPWARLCIECQGRAEAYALHEERFSDAA